MFHIIKKYIKHCIAFERDVLNLYALVDQKKREEVDKAIVEILDVAKELSIKTSVSFQEIRTYMLNYFYRCLAECGDVEKALTKTVDRLKKRVTT